MRGDGPRFIRMSPRAIGYMQADLDDWLLTPLIHNGRDFGLASVAESTD